MKRSDVNSAESFSEYAHEQMSKVFTIYDINGKEHKLSAKEIGFTLSIEKLPKQVLGRCTHSDKKVLMSIDYVNLNVAENAYYITDTLLHEIAHAFQYHIYPSVRVYKNGKWSRKIQAHGKEWKSIAKQVGAMPTATKDLSSLNMEMPKSKYTLICDTCKSESPAHRKMTRKRSCGQCSSVYNPKYELRTIKNF